ncbi:TPD1 protein homolog 1-like [Musa acuminata AAA Group]|uniref:TPD1 protein homolog 1-like n=1 Tax=Musa acuminata AAA Group TaxID=214697 RepID=UPI0031D1778A
MACFHGLVALRLAAAFLNFVFISSLLQHGELDLMGEAVQIPSMDLTAQSRKLLGIELNVTTTGRGFVGGVANVGKMMEMTGEEVCSKDDIVVHQEATPPLPSGIPTYTVQVLNTCPSGCAVAGIHLSCGWYGSARLVDPRIFRRLSYNDCLVNDGASLPAGDSISFQYANSFRYPLSVSSVTC